jgi:hypothetical protein
MGDSATPVPSRFVLEFDWLGLRSDEDTWSGSEVNRLISEVLVEGFPAVDFSHGDLTRGEQRSEQHGGSFGRRQHRLCLDAALELLVEPLDCIGGPRAVARQGCKKTVFECDAI